MNQKIACYKNCQILIKKKDADIRPHLYNVAKSILQKLFIYVKALSPVTSIPVINKCMSCVPS